MRRPARTTRSSRAKAGPAPAGPANQARGEIAIELEGVSYPLRPSFQAIGEIETATGQTLYDLAVLAEGGGLSLSDIGIIVSACIRAYARSENKPGLDTMKPERAAELVYGETGGVLTAMKVVLKPLLLFAVTGGYTATGFPTPQTTSPTPAPV